jgi:hypothetical protein
MKNVVPGTGKTTTTLISRKDDVVASTTQEGSDLIFIGCWLKAQLAGR